MSAGYVELHAKSFYSFGTGASHVHELLAQAGEYGYPALALTDANLCGALEFARLSGSLGIRPITGGELTLTDGSRLVLLAKTRQGYANISRLFTLANSADRREPRLDPAYLPEHAGGVILLTGGRDGPLSRLLEEGRPGEAERLLGSFREWYGPDGVYLELQQNFLRGIPSATGNWRGWLATRTRHWPPPTTFTTIARNGTGCSTPWPQPGATLPSSRPCPTSIPTITSASSRPSGCGKSSASAPTPSPIR